MSLETRLSKLEIIWQTSDPRTIEERRHVAWRRFQELIDRRLHCTPELRDEMEACGATLAQIAKDRYDRVGFEPLPTDEGEMGPL